MAKKHKNHIGGFEAPRNSLELPAESYHSCNNAKEYEPNSCIVSQNMPKRGSFSTNASMKKLISDEMSRGSNHKQRSPSVVARLMGMDGFPSDTNSIVQHLELEDDSAGLCILQKNREMISNGYASKKSSRDKDLHSSDKHVYSRSLSNGMELGKPRSRVHPQEKELQQFKKDFEAWQASRFLECAKVVELEKIPDQWLAQLDLTKEKVSAYENAKKAAFEKAQAIMRERATVKRKTSSEYKKSSFSPKYKKSNAFRTKSMDMEFEDVSMMDFEKSSDKSYVPARIVILKPGPESFSSNDESWASSSGSVDDRDCIEDLLEEVKDRLKSEIRGKMSKRGNVIRGGGIETPFKNRPTHPKQTAEDLRTRTTITGDLAKRLRRSESTRSYRSQIHPNDNLPEYTRQEAKQLLSERLRSVLNGQKHQDTSNIFNCSSRQIDFDDTRGRLEKVRNILNATNGRNQWNDSNHGNYAEARSFRHEFADSETSEEELSPRNLVRSLSAPASGTSFGKLLLEDRHILTGAHVRRKHEAVESVGINRKDEKKESFKLREKVTNIKYNFTLKGKLFSRKFHSFDLSQGNEYDLIKDINSGPTVLLNLPDRNENYTEVPPSPASVCSSPHEELWKTADDPGSISRSDITSVEDQIVGNACRDISSNHNGYEESEVTTVTDDPLDVEVEHLEDESEAYIRDLLVASGLYNGSSKNSFSSWDSNVKLIDDWVFDKVEESYIKPNEPEDHHNNESSFHHKMLFDLLNEALTIVLKPSKTFSRFRRNITAPTPSQTPQGRKLLQKVWGIICQYIYLSPDNEFPSLEDMVSYDLGSVRWSDLIDEELKVVCKDLEVKITSELIEEIIKDMQATALTMS